MSTPLWFSLFTHDKYMGQESPFAETSSIKGIKELELNYQVISDELKEYLNTHNLQSHFNATMVENPQTWKVQGLRVWGLENYKKQKFFPKTMKLINAIPNVTLISFNLLEPQSNIKLHCGDTNAIIRCHLGLKIPAQAPECAIKVKNEIKDWQEGKVIGFIDAFEHEAWNKTNEERIILLFDIVRPEYAKKKRSVCAIVRTALFIQQFGNSFPGLYTVNRKIFKIILQPHIMFLRVRIPLRNLVRFTWNKYIKA